jgi:hypothetical protein
VAVGVSGTNGRPQAVLPPTNAHPVVVRPTHLHNCVDGHWIQHTADADVEDGGWGRRVCTRATTRPWACLWGLQQQLCMDAVGHRHAVPAHNGWGCGRKVPNHRLCGSCWHMGRQAEGDGRGTTARQERAFKRRAGRQREPPPHVTGQKAGKLPQTMCTLATTSHAPTPSTRNIGSADAPGLGAGKEKRLQRT